jgi:Pao retrotransposon peptidase
MDDVLWGGFDVKECIELTSDLNKTLKQGCFTLTKWWSNDKGAMVAIDDERLLDTITQDPSATIKILGILYNRSEDNFAIEIKSPKEIVYSKRGLASYAASIYDPLGFLLPYVMKFRILLKKLWKLKLDWDDALSPELQSEVNNLIKNIKLLRDIKIPRYFGTDQNNNLEIIAFGDASGDAIGAILYGRTINNGQINVQIIAAKGNITKVNTTEVIESNQNTIPKNELKAMLAAAELYQLHKNSFSHLKTTFRL